MVLLENISIEAILLLLYFFLNRRTIIEDRIRIRQKMFNFNLVMSLDLLSLVLLLNL